MVQNGKKKCRLKTKEGKTITLERQQMRCLPCAFLLWGIEINSSRVRQITLRNGHIANELIEKRAARLEKQAPPSSALPDQLVISADGVMVHTSGEWHEVKTVAFGEFESQWDAKNKQVNTKTKNISYFSRAETAEAFERSALYEWQRCGGCLIVWRKREG